MIDETFLDDKKQSYSLFAQNIIRAKGVSIFADDKAMSCLAKDDSFFKELMSIFNNLFHLGVKPNVFQNALDNVQLSQIDEKRLTLCSKLFSEYISIMEENKYDVPFSSIKNIKMPLCENSNDEIKKRIDLLKQVYFNTQNDDVSMNLCDETKYFVFSDVQKEFEYITQFIKNEVEKKSAYFKDFAVFIDGADAREKFINYLKSEKIPVIGRIYNENYENIKRKILVYQRISELCKELGLQSFQSNSFKDLHLFANLKQLSKSQKEICLQKLDEEILLILDEIFENSYSVDKIVNKKENSTFSKSLVETVFSQWNTLEDKEKDILNNEFGLIKNFYDFYKDGNFAKAIEVVIKRYLVLFENTTLKDVVLGKIKSLNELQTLYNNVLNELPVFQAFADIMQWLPYEENDCIDAVFLSSLSGDLNPNIQFKNVFVLGMTESSFPGNNFAYPVITNKSNELICEEIRKLCPTLSTKTFYFLQTDKQFKEQRFFKLLNIMASATSCLVLSTHITEANKRIQLSQIFKLLISKDNENLQIINDEIENETNNSIENKVVSSKSISDVIISDTDELKLSASSINTYLNCPRKYYYKHLLNLKEESNFAASYGSIVHAVFEVMNRKYLNSYNMQTALSLGDALFEIGLIEFDNDAEEKIVELEKNALDKGFSQNDIELVKASDRLSLAEMKEKFQNAIREFDILGYFSKPPQKAVCEIPFSFSIPDIPNVVFDGRIDAILMDEDGKYSVVDYKTGKNKINSLSYAISDNGVNFLSRSGKQPANVATLQKAYDYQIPLYYLACKYANEFSEYKSNLDKLGLLYVRPSYVDGGCDEDFVSAEQIEDYSEKIIQNLKNTVIDKIKNEKEFLPEKSFACGYCSYKYLCDEVIDDV